MFNKIRKERTPERYAHYIKIVVDGKLQVFKHAYNTKVWVEVRLVAPVVRV